MPKGVKGFQKGHTIWLGKKRSPDVIEKMSKSHLGKKAWNIGTKGVMKPNKTSFKKGKNNRNWKDGVTPINELIRTGIEYKLWRKSNIERDNFTCQKYGTSGGDLQVHHINNFADFPELRFAIDNGITLSKKAHKEFHKKYGYKNNTREQLQEYLTNNKL